MKLIQRRPPNIKSHSFPQPQHFSIAFLTVRPAGLFKWPGSFLFLKDVNTFLFGLFHEWSQTPVTFTETPLPPSLPRSPPGGVKNKHDRCICSSGLFGQEDDSIESKPPSCYRGGEGRKLLR